MRLYSWGFTVGKKPLHGNRDCLQKTLKYTNYCHLRPLRRQQQKRLISKRFRRQNNSFARQKIFGTILYPVTARSLMKLPNLTRPRGCKHVTMTWFSLSFRTWMCSLIRKVNWSTLSLPSPVFVRLIANHNTHTNILYIYGPYICWIN